MTIDGRRLQFWVRSAAWFCVGIIVVLSLVPGAGRPHTVFPGKIEHMIAYAGTGLFAIAGYRLRKSRLIFWFAVATLSFVLEYLQNFSPGRSPNVLDAVASSLGLTAGMTLGVILIAQLMSPNE
jgi:VanZ family protein